MAHDLYVISTPQKFYFNSMEEDMHRVKVVQVGINGFGQYITGILQRCNNIELVGVYDIDKNHVIMVSNALNIKPFYSMEDALACDCDGVILEVPNNVHAELAKCAAMAKKHIFVEKPITNSIEEAEAIIKLCKEQGVLLQVGHSMRFMAKYRKAKELLVQKAIGRIVLIEANSSTQRAKRHTSEVWRYSRETCPGGPMLQLGIHAVDTIFFLTGCQPVKIYGMFTDDFTATQNEDAGVVIMKMENEILAYVGSSYVSPLTESMIIYGDDGRIDIRDNTIILNKDGQDIIIDIPKQSEDDSYIKQFEGFADSILNNRRPEVDGETGLQNLEVVLRALKSGGN